MSVYKTAVDRIRSHSGYHPRSALDASLFFNMKSASMAKFIKLNACLITARHDLNPKYSGRDFLVNLMTDVVVLHISTKGEYTLHHWEKNTACSRQNQLTSAKERDLLGFLLK